MQKRKNGFTLMELLVTIAIIAVLASVSVVGYLVYLKQAKQSNATSTLSQIKTLFTLEDLSNDDFEISTDGMTFAYTGTETASADTTLTKFKTVFTKMETGIELDDKNRLYIVTESSNAKIVESIIYCFDGAYSQWNCKNGNISSLEKTAFDALNHTEVTAK